jgi:thioesterase domain-containing protein
MKRWSLGVRFQVYLDVVATKITSNGRSVVKLGLIDIPKRPAPLATSAAARIFMCL